MKTHSLYPYYFRASAVTGRMIYRGETIEVRLSLDVEKPLLAPEERRKALNTWQRWYWHGNCGTICLRSQLDSIDCKLAGVPEEAARLRALPLGAKIGVSWNEWDHIKTDIQGEHEGPGNWFVNIRTGVSVHYTTLAAWRAGYTPRPELTSVVSGGKRIWKIA